MQELQKKPQTTKQNLPEDNFFLLRRTITRTIEIMMAMTATPITMPTPALTSAACADATFCFPVLYSVAEYGLTADDGVVRLVDGIVRVADCRVGFSD